MAEWKTYKLIKKVASGTAKNGDIIDLKKYSDGHPWSDMELCVGISSLDVYSVATTYSVRYEKLDSNRFRILTSSGVKAVQWLASEV